eukprot:94758_1
MALLLISLVCLLLLISTETCPYTGITFTSTLTLTNNIDNNCVIDGCTFSNIIGAGIIIQENVNITIKNCVLQNISDDGIQFNDVYFTQNIVISNNNFHTIGGRGIFVTHHSNLIIEYNTLHNIGQVGIKFEGPSSSNGSIIQYNNISNVSGYGINCDQTHRNISIIGNIIHSYESSAGIIIHGPNFRVIGNIVFDTNHINGNGINVRSFGIVANNIVFNTTRRGIAYYSARPGYDGQLIIENNIVYNIGYGFDHAPISLSVANMDNNIDHAIVRFNTLIGHCCQNVIFIEDQIDFMIEIYGNILVHPLPALPALDNITYEYISDSLWISKNECNLQTHNISDIPFVDSNDFHIFQLPSITFGYCTGFNFQLSKYDIDGDIRGENGRIDVGADRWNGQIPTFEPTYNPTANATSDPSNNPSFYPSISPSYLPTIYPSINPTINPSFLPTIYPSIYPSLYPSINPSINPSIQPTFYPSSDPSFYPTFIPTIYNDGIVDEYTTTID